MRKDRRRRTLPVDEERRGRERREHERVLVNFEVDYKCTVSPSAADSSRSCVA
jgi:hypothetical protein